MYLKLSGIVIVIKLLPEQPSLSSWMHLINPSAHQKSQATFIECYFITVWDFSPKWLQIRRNVY